MGKPAARIGDEHECPQVTPVPHVGGPVIGTGCLTVFIEGQPAARVGDPCTCMGEPDSITSGSSGVFICGAPAARMGDRTAHGGVVISGSGTVFIGEIMGHRELTPAEKSAAIDQAIRLSIVLLENKIRLLEQNDPDTLMAFKRWFGREDEESKGMILERMRRALEGCKRLKKGNFKSLSEGKKGEKDYAFVYSWDKKHSVSLGAKFWEEKDGINTKAGVIIHELSHFRDIGNTDDITYGERGCLSLAEFYPEEAVKNADSFEYFIKGPIVEITKN